MTQSDANRVLKFLMDRDIGKTLIECNTELKNSVLAEIILTCQALDEPEKSDTLDTAKLFPIEYLINVQSSLERNLFLRGKAIQVNGVKIKPQTTLVEFKNELQKAFRKL